MSYILYVQGGLIHEDLTYEEINEWETYIMPDMEDNIVFMVVAEDEDGNFVSYSESFIQDGTLYRMVQYPRNPHLYMQVVNLKEESK